MPKKRGFTLIELLAVIVILAIIALIATPIILGVIETSRQGAAKSSALGYIDAIEKQLAVDMLTPENVIDVTDNNIEIGTDDVGLVVKGTKPTSGTLIVNKETGIIESGTLVVKMSGKSYNIKYDGKTGKATIEGTNETEDLNKVIILDEAKKLVYDENGSCKTDGTTYQYMGGCYIKGASDNNYIWYNGFMWRIMGINSDNTVRLITDENVTELPYGSNYSIAEKYATNVGYINDWLNNYFYEKLNSTKSIIKKGNYFCVESTTDSSRTNDNCTSGKEINVKVGMVSLDEKNLAGGSESYLHISQSFWTITPYSNIQIWAASYYSFNSNTANVYDPNGVRPVINVEATAAITNGTGNIKNYYVLAEDKTNYKTGKIGEIATSGEYVKLEGKIYRVVSKEEDGVKLILDGYYDKKIPTEGDPSILTTSSGVIKALNNEVLTWLDLADSDKLNEKIWYQGTAISMGADAFRYTDSLSDDNIIDNGNKFKVGLIRMGEILSSNTSTILTNNYTEASSYNNPKTNLLMNKNKYSNMEWIILNSGSPSTWGAESQDTVRPVIVVKSELPISGGTGTWDNPYEI